MNQLERSSTDIMFFDTETTGIPLFKEPSGSEGQPHMVDLAGLRYTKDGVLVGVVSQIIKPEGWVIPQETIDVHGITNEIANGKIPEGFMVCHICDNPPCCNPSHLMLGTVKSNAADMLIKNRKKNPSQLPGVQIMESQN